MPDTATPVPLPAAATIVRGDLIGLENVEVTYGRGARALKALDRTTLSINQGEFVALVGPSGCGKSTILKLVSGLLAPSTGKVVVGGKPVRQRTLQVGMAFQNPTMLPWLRVRDNVMLPLKIVAPYKHQFRAKRKTEYRDKVEALLSQVGLAGFGDKYPWQLSGGMLQRASLCRALIHEPQLLLLDEPFGALDQFTREELWSTLQDLWLTRRPTVLLVTHDLREATYLSTRIVVMSARPGRISAVHEVPLARPRGPEIRSSATFLALTEALWSAIQPEWRQSMTTTAA